MMPKLVLAGTSSGVGKTTLAMGIMAALARRGMRVQPFKVGPDYIDPSYHLAATGVPSRNLDSWMVARDAMLQLFDRACRNCDVAVVEGVMGVFDGASGLDEAGSTAQVAKLLNAPVVLVLDASKAARSIAATALGFARFDPDLPLAGFLLNHVHGETHYRWAREAIESLDIAPVLGHLPADRSLSLPERHLGLIPTEERGLPEGFLDRLVSLVEEHVNVQHLIDISRQQSAVSPHPDPLPRGEGEGRALFPADPIPPRATIAVARDEAFSFYYQDNLDLLAAHGARLLPFSPLRDESVPAGAGALYLGGGFPEVQARQLAANRSMIESVTTAVRNGIPTYGECGGLMYLTEGIEDAEGEIQPMVGAVPGICSMKERRLHLGYVEVRSAADSPLGPAGTQARGHEFHWSTWNGLDPAMAAYSILNQAGRPEGFVRGNVLASFIHIHFGANPELAPAFVRAAAGGPR